MADQPPKPSNVQQNPNQVFNEAGEPIDHVGDTFASFETVTTTAGASQLRPLTPTTFEDRYKLNSADQVPKAQDRVASLPPVEAAPPAPPATPPLPEGPKRGNIASVNAVLDIPEKDFHHGVHRLAYNSSTPINRFKKAIAAYESGDHKVGYGNYDDPGPVVKSGSYRGQRARGAYQVMPPNLKNWGNESAKYLQRKGYGTEITEMLQHLNTKKFEDPRVQELLVTSRFEGLREGAPEFFGKGETPKPKSYDQMAHDWFGHGASDGYTKNGVYHSHVMNAFAALGGERGEPAHAKTQVASNAAVVPKDAPEHAEHHAAKKHHQAAGNHRRSRHHRSQFAIENPVQSMSPLEQMAQQFSADVHAGLQKIGLEKPAPQEHKKIRTAEAKKSSTNPFMPRMGV